jgi:lysosomal acid phosphatase
LFFLCFFSQKGKQQQQYQLGEWLRQRYNGLVSDKYNNTETRVESTNIDRVIMSAQANLVGFYPPKANDLWNENLPWQPIPVHSIPETEDNYLQVTKSCPAYDRELEKLFETKEFRLLEEEYEPITNTSQDTQANQFEPLKMLSTFTTAWISKKATI